MLQKIVLRCSFTCEERASYNWGSIMHGVLMELLPGDIVEILHESSLNPYSQYVIPLSENELEWHIGIWDNDFSNILTKAVLPLTQINLRHKGITLDVTSVNREIKSEEDFLSQFFAVDNPCRRYRLEFLTPCTHKSGGEYVLFPSSRLILQSLLMRFSAYSNSFTLEDEEVLSHLTEYTKIVHYSLRTATFHLKDAGITGYIGRVILSIRGPEQLARLCGMLLSFAEYAGVGIKTSLGMGGCNVTPEYFRNKK